MTKQDQIKELAEVIRKDYPEVNAEHISTIAVEWFNIILHDELISIEIGVAKMKRIAFLITGNNYE